MSRFCFTDQDTTTTHINLVIAWIQSLSTVIYAIIGLEVAPTTNHQHLQGFVNIHGLKWSTLKSKMPKAHIEISKGSDEHNKAYCSKEQILFEQGNPSNQGKRNDLETIYADIEAGMPFQGLVLKHRAAVFRYERIVRSMMVHKRRVEVEETEIADPKEVCIFFGNTRTGKTSAARAEAVGAIYQVFNPRWWDGYEDGHHSTVLFDEFKGTHPIEDILQITDRWPVIREIKGGTTIVCPKKIVFTSEGKPHESTPQESLDVWL
ncbi:MAG: uncharacterized protein KVP18_004849 [Porospora cf. gigantea A]|uniref:uncharacterized protein n=1 Tax=Porospora cf. gigantea A TaxID=2853593 RepID=UPI003559D60C|nr:MAG: hypothetical protein KVP18_004849 [Porospora cf. gigantea A]